MQTELVKSDKCSSGDNPQEQEDAKNIPLPVEALPKKAPASPKITILPKGPISVSTIGKDLFHENFFAIGENNALYVGGIKGYRPIDQREMGRKVSQYLEDRRKEDKWSSHLVGEVMNYIRTLAPSLWENPPQEEVQVMNGILEVRTRTCRIPNPNWLGLVKIPVFYDPQATCPEIDQFLRSIFPEDAIELGYELAADLLTPDRSIQKAILLYGTGGNGKSTFLNLLSCFIGRGNISNISLHELESNRFAPSGLYGKLANICSDLPSKSLGSNSMFKALTGGDQITAEQKYGHPFEFTPYARLIFATNHLPKSADVTEAFFDRWLVIPFDRSFRGTKEEVNSSDLLRKLTQPNELSGLLNRALEVWPRLRKEGFTESPCMKAALGIFQAETDPVSQWADQALLYDSDSWILKEEVRAAYNQSPQNKGNPPLTDVTFGKRFKRVFPDLKEAQRTIGGQVKRGYLGVRIKPGDS